MELCIFARAKKTFNFGGREDYKGRSGKSGCTNRPPLRDAMSGRDFKGTIHTAGFVAKFSCLGADCEDTCCRGWGMQMDALTRDLYQKEAPELLDAITTGEAELIMKRDPNTDYCVKFDNGLCGVHASKGSKFLGDACHFYPRITRSIGDDVHMSAALSCPEITRLALYSDDEGAFDYVPVSVERLPESLRNYMLEGMEVAAALETMKALQQMVLNAPTSARAMAVVVNVAQSLKIIAPKSWAQAVPLYIKIAEGRLPPPEVDSMDDYRLVNILVGLIVAAKKTNRPRLEEVIARMEQALAIKIDRNSLDMMSLKGDLTMHEVLQVRWQKKAAAALDGTLKRWIAAQLSMASFPFAGLGGDVLERAIILAVRFATVKLALKAQVDENGVPPPPEKVVEVVQSIARFTDHLADPTFSIMAYNEVGWSKERRLRALVGDT